MHILIADDNEEVRRVLSLQMRLYDFQTTVAVDGQDAFEKFEKDTFDLVLTDLKMPRLSGIELIRKIRNQGNPIPCILITGFPSQSLEDQLHRIDHVAYYTKPVESAVLKEAIERMTLPSEG